MKLWYFIALELGEAEVKLLLMAVLAIIVFAPTAFTQEVPPAPEAKNRPGKKTNGQTPPKQKDAKKAPSAQKKQQQPAEQPAGKQQKPEAKDDKSSNKQPQVTIRLNPIVSPGRGEILLIATTTAAVEAVTFLRNGKPLGQAKKEKKQWHYRWRTAKTTDGIYQIGAQATFKKQKFTAVPQPVVVDNTAPIISVDSIQQKPGRQVVLTISIRDKTTAVSTSSFWLDQKTVPAQLVASGRYQIVWQVPAAARGYHLLEISASDKAGNHKKLEHKIRLDLQGPRIQVLSPLAQGPSRGPLACEVKITDPAAVADVRFVLQQQPQPQMTSWHQQDKWGAKWDGLGDGLYRIRVTAVDKLGNSNNIDIYAQIDETAPIVEWITPKKDILTNQKTPLQINVIDNASILEVSLLVADKKAMVLQRQGDFWGGEFVPDKEGEYLLTVQAKDAAGNIGKSQPRRLVYDISAPTGKIIVPPQPFFSKTLPVKIHINERLAGMKSVTICLNKQTITAKSSAPDIWSAEIALQQSGEQQLSARLLDRAGNRTQLAAITIRVDHTPPVLTWPDGVPPLIFTTKGEIAVSVKDESSAVEYLSIWLNDKLIKKIERPQPDCRVDFATAPLADGKYRLRLEAADQAGNIGRAPERSLLIDRHAPQITTTLTPNSLQIGMVRALLTLKDDPAGVSTNAKPKIFMELRDKRYPFTILDFTATQCEAKFLITRNHPEGKAIVYVEGITDLAGHQLQRTKIGEFVIKGPGGSWPLLPGQQPHPVLAANSKKVPSHLSGCWVAAAANAPVKAIEDGQIVEASISEYKQPGYLRIKRLRGNLVWGYHHLVPGKKPASGKCWSVGDIVKAGETLGNVAAVGSQPQSFIYLEIISRQKEQWLQVDNPLKYLHPPSSDNRITPQILLTAKKTALTLPPYLDFRIPKGYKPPLKMSSNYRFTDLLIILYTLLAIGVLSSILLWSRDKTTNFTGE